jgi:hypothetical protein
VLGSRLDNPKAKREMLLLVCSKTFLASVKCMIRTVECEHGCHNEAF